MNQSDSPIDSEVDFGLLMAYIDGAVDSKTRQGIEDRLARDPALRAEVQGLAEMQAALAHGLREDLGPTTQELGEYALGLLPADEAAALEDRLAGDPVRRAEVERLRRYLAGPSVPQAAESSPRPAGRISVIVAELAAGLSHLGGAGTPAPVPAGLRGGKAMPVTYRAGSGEVVLEVQGGAEGEQKRTMLGLLVGFEGTETMTASLFSGDEPVAGAACDELGNFTVEDVAPGQYDLVLRGAEIEILVEGVVVE